MIHAGNFSEAKLLRLANPWNILAMVTVRLAEILNSDPVQTRSSRDMFSIHANLPTVYPNAKIFSGI